MRKEMQTLLDDIELDIQELKYLMQVLATDANPTLKVVAKRNIQQMRARLDALQKLLDETPVELPFLKLLSLQWLFPNRLLLLNRLNRFL